MNWLYYIIKSKLFDRILLWTYFILRILRVEYILKRDNIQIPWGLDLRAGRNLDRAIPASIKLLSCWTDKRYVSLQICSLVLFPELFVVLQYFNILMKQNALGAARPYTVHLVEPTDLYCITLWLDCFLIAWSCTKKELPPAELYRFPVLKDLNLS